MAFADLFPLRSVEVMPSSLTFRRPYVTARGQLAHRDTVLLRIETAPGLGGLGEAVPLSLRGGESRETVIAQLDEWGRAARVAASPDDPELSAARGRLGRPARSAVMTALADARSRARNIPLHRFLFSLSADAPQFEPYPPALPILCNATLTSGPPAEVRRQAEEWAADGFTTFKLKLGPEGDTGQTGAVRRALESGVKIRLDVNACWSVEQAVREIRDLEQFDLELVEQPVASLEEMARLRELVAVPLVADESVASESDARRAAELGACDAITVKLSKTGTLDPTLGGYLPTYLSSALDGPVGLAAAAHVAVAARRRSPDSPWNGVAQGLATRRLFTPDERMVGPKLDGPWLTPPDGPGLGVTLENAE